MASQESEEVDEDDMCAHRIGVLMAPVKREDVRANVVRSRIGDRSIDLHNAFCLWPLGSEVVAKP